MRTCDGCGQDFSADEISAYLDRVLCPKCYPKLDLAALRKTKQHSPYMALSLSVLIPGAGHVYAGKSGQGWAINLVLMGMVILGFVVTGFVSAVWFLGTLVGVGVLLPAAVIAIGGHAYRVSLRVRKGELPMPESLTPVWVFLGFGILELGVVVLVLIGVIVHLVRSGQLERLLG